MIEGSLSRRYTKALFQLAQEEGQEETVGQELERFLAAHTGSPLQTVLNNPAFAIDSRKKIVLRVAATLQLSRLTVNFLSMLLERDRISYVPGIVACYRRFLNQAKGRVEAKVTLAMPLEAPHLEQLKETLRQISGKVVLLQEATDGALIGGARIELEGRVYDGSVQTQLAKMKERIMRGY